MNKELLIGSLIGGSLISGSLIGGSYILYNIRNFVLGAPKAELKRAEGELEEMKREREIQERVAKELEEQKRERERQQRVVEELEEQKRERERLQRVVEELEEQKRERERQQRVAEELEELKRERERLQRVAEELEELKSEREEQKIRLVEQIRTKKNNYDLALNIDRLNIDNWNFAIPPNFNEETYCTKKTLVVAVVGYFKVGKTHHINKLFDLNLPLWKEEGEDGNDELMANDTYGISIISPEDRICGGGVLVLDCAGKDAPIEWREEGRKVKYVEQIDDFTLNVAMEISDVVIICVERIGIQTTKFIRHIQQTIQDMDIPGFDKLYVLHNYKDLESSSKAAGTFKKYVTTSLNAKPESQNVTLKDGVRKMELFISRFDDLKYPTMHFLLGREGEDSGNQFNVNVYDVLRTHIACMMHRAKPRNIVTDLMMGMNKQICHVEELKNKKVELEDNSHIKLVEENKKNE